MDVIALAEGGFGEAVAPLGTALTEEQVKLLWRLAPEPLLCFDGDTAGRKAAFRAVETVLPLLRPGFSVRFAFLPGGLDPDDLIRQQGADAFAAELERTRALFDVLWEREAEGQDLSTPEQRAAFETRLKAMTARIGDATVKDHYERELRETLWTLNRSVVREIARGEGQRRAGRGGMRRNVAPDWRVRERARMGPRMNLGQAMLPHRAAAASPELSAQAELAPAREALLLKTLLNHPWLIEGHSEEISALNLGSAPLARLRDAVLLSHAVENTLDSHALPLPIEPDGPRQGR